MENLSIETIAQKLDEIAIHFNNLGLPIHHLCNAKKQLTIIDSALCCEHLNIEPNWFHSTETRGIEWICKRCGKVIDVETLETLKTD